MTSRYLAGAHAFYRGKQENVSDLQNRSFSQNQGKMQDAVPAGVLLHAANKNCGLTPWNVKKESPFMDRNQLRGES
ncbi:MAG: hypothetical protein B5M56_07505 [Desulfococcus sp. 4484_241]|nr:MAG: hypothetical protein B5M56_07505 [Desulfococcus sp. 4484_241]